jgi:hypothetical protein
MTLSYIHDTQRGTAVFQTFCTKFQQKTVPRASDNAETSPPRQEYPLVSAVRLFEPRSAFIGLLQ